MGKIRDQIESIKSIDINQINKFDKFFFIYILIFILFLVFFDILKVKPIGTESETYFYIYQLHITLVFTIIILRLHIVNIVSMQFRNFINRIFGFINPISLGFFLQILLLVSYINISEIVGLMRTTLSQTVSTNNGYYFIMGWIILGVFFQTAKLVKMNKNTDSQILNIQNKYKTAKNESESFKNLFDE